VAPSTAVELVRQHGDGAAAKLTDIKDAAKKRGKGDLNTLFTSGETWTVE